MADAHQRPLDAGAGGHRQGFLRALIVDQRQRAAQRAEAGVKLLAGLLDFVFEHILIACTGHAHEIPVGLAEHSGIEVTEAFIQQVGLVVQGGFRQPVHGRIDFPDRLAVDGRLPHGEHRDRASQQQPTLPPGPLQATGQHPQHRHRLPDEQHHKQGGHPRIQQLRQAVGLAEELQGAFQQGHPHIGGQPQHRRHQHQPGQTVLLGQKNPHDQPDERPDQVADQPLQVEMPLPLRTDPAKQQVGQRRQHRQQQKLHRRRHHPVQRTARPQQHPQRRQSIVGQVTEHLAGGP